MTIELLGTHFSTLNLKETVNHLEHILDENLKEPYHVITANPEIVMQIQRSEQLQSIEDKAGMITPDGIGIKLGAKLLGMNIEERVTGIDLLEEILQLASKRNFSIYFLGAKPEVNDDFFKYCKRHYPTLKISGCRHGYFNQEESLNILDEINEQDTTILITALGSPKGLLWFDAIREQLKVKMVMDVGGSFDTLTGHVKRAPLWIQKVNMEWFYRRVKDSSRAKRQKDLYAFAKAVFRKKLNPDKYHSIKKSSGCN